MNKRDITKLVKKHESVWYNQDESHLERSYTVSNYSMPPDVTSMYVMNKIMRLIVRNITSEKNREYKYYVSRDGFGTLDVRYVLKTHSLYDAEHGKILISVYDFRFESFETTRMAVMFIFDENGLATMTVYSEKQDDDEKREITKNDSEYWMGEIRNSLRLMTYSMGYRFDKKIVYRRRRKKNKPTNESA